MKEATGIESYIEKYFRGSIKKFALYAYLFAIPFSHAPSAIHPLITFPGLLSLLIIGFYLIQKSKKPEHLIILSLPLISVCLSVVINLSYFSNSSVNHTIAYFWFFLLAISLLGLLDKTSLSIKKAFKLLLITVLFTSMYSFIESFMHLLNIDLGSYIPRYDRQTYQFWTPFFFFRSRGFNFESANLALLFNTAYPLLYYYYSKHRIKIMSVWAFSLLFTFSAYHLLLFSLFILFLMLKKFLSFLKNYQLYTTTLFISVIVFVIMIFSVEQLFLVFSYILDKASGDSVSSQTRLELFNTGIQILNENPLTGVGMAGYYFYIDSGLNNFYLQAFVQMGVFGITVILFVLYLFFVVLKTKNFYLIASFIMGWSHLFLIADFWLPQLFLPLIFAQLLYRQNNHISFEKGRLIQ